MELFLCVVTHPFLWIIVGLVGVAYAIQWLVSQKGTLFDITGFIQTSFGLNHVPKYVIRLIWYLWIILFMAMLFSISYALYNIILMISRPDTKLESLRVSAYALPAMVVPLSALIAFPITVLRQHYNRRQTEAEEEGLITDRINAAVASLGADKIVKGSEGKETTEPNIEVRVGAILALERLAQKNDDVHVQIMEILCSYLRENTKSPLLDEKNDNFLKPREDVQMALTVIGRRTDAKIRLETEAKFRIDLQGCHLEKANLTDANLKLALLMHTKLNEAIFEGTRLNGAILNDAILTKAKLNDTILDDAHLAFTYFCKTELNYIDFTDTFLQFTRFIEVDLTRTQFNPDEAFHAVKFDGSIIKDIDLENTLIDQSQLNKMFGDASVILNEPYVIAPQHWPTISLDFRDLKRECKRWIRDPEGYKFDSTHYEPNTP